MKKLINLFCLTLMAMATVTLSSCGDDEKDEIMDNGDSRTTAVHRIKISVTGDPGTFKWSANFNGLTWHDNRAEQAIVYDEYGNALGEKTDNFSSLTGQTTKEGTALAAAMVITDFEENNNGEITVRLEGYIDGKLANSMTYTFRGGEKNVHSIGFTTVPLD